MMHSIYEVSGTRVGRLEKEETLLTVSIQQHQMERHTPRVS